MKTDAEKIRNAFAQKGIILQGEEIVKTQSGAIAGRDYIDQNGRSINIVKYPVDGNYGVFLPIAGRTRLKYSGSTDQIVQQITLDKDEKSDSV